MLLIGQEFFITAPSLLSEQFIRVRRDLVSLFGCRCVVVPTGLGCELWEGRCLRSVLFLDLASTQQSV